MIDGSQQSVSITSAGGAISIKGSATFKRAGGSNTRAVLQMYRGGTKIWEGESEILSDGESTSITGECIDTPGSGSKTYYLKGAGTPYGISPGASNRFLSLNEDKGK